MTALPEGWQSKTLKELCLPITKSDPAEIGRAKIRYIDIGSVDGATHSLVDVPEIDAVGAPSRCRQIVKGGDTVFSTVRPYLEKIAYIDNSLEDQFASTGFAVLRPGPALLPRYLYYYAISRGMLDQVLPYQKGVSYPAVLDKEVRATAVPVPPLREQQHIVELLEDHLSRLDVAIGSVRASLRRLDVLRRLALKEVAIGDAVPLKQLAFDSGYGTSVKCEVGGAGPAVVRIPNLIDGRIDLSDEKRAVDATVDLSNSMLVPGDVLIIRTNGSKDLIGRSGVVQDGVDAAFASYLIRYQVDTSRLRPEWLHAALGSPALRAEIERLAASSAGQHNLSLGKLDGLQIPTPSLEEQDAGLARLAEMDDHAGALRKALVATLRRGESLRRSLLAVAFSGGLNARARSAA